VELTVPWEECLQTAHEKKRLKYQDLVDEASTSEWNARLFAIKVGCRAEVFHHIPCRSSSVN